MATLEDKMFELKKFVNNTLNIAIGLAEMKGEYKEFEKAMKEVHAAEARLKAVRATVRAKMRKTRQAFQDACPHENKVDTRVRQTYDGQRVVEFQTCSNCSKSFDLRIRVD